MTDIDYIEIGTSDLHTEIQKSNKSIGLSIDPISYYIDRLPNKTGCIKKVLAISDNNSNTKAYWIHPSIISKYKLSKWLRGCNSIGDYHPTGLKQILKKGLDPTNIFTIENIQTKTLLKLMIDENIKTVKYIKIDTEGHDCIIINHFLKEIVDTNSYMKLPTKIRFECNILTNPTTVLKTIENLESFGFEIYSQNKNDIVMKRPLILDL